jgi:uncharacterized glyoxalase superfamily protein PhnB
MARISRIAPEVPVNDLRESIEYYERQLGFQSVMELPDGEYAIVERDGIAVHLFYSGAAAQQPVGLHIFTEELEDLYSEFLARGAQITQQITLKPWGNRDFRVKDRSGNEIKFTESRADD